MNILYISGTPTHPTDAGNRKVTLSTCELFKSLGHEVHFLYIDERGFNNSRQDEFEECFIKTQDYWKERFHYFRIRNTRKAYFNILRIFQKRFVNGHRGLFDTYPPGLHHFINKLDKNYHFGACIVNYIWLTKAFRYVRIPIKACFTHDAMAYKNLKVKEKVFWVDAAQEARALQLCTDIFAIQDEERAYFQVLSPNSRIYTIYNKYDYTPQPITNNKNILFLSGNNGFNQNGLKWFVNDVLPLIRAKYQDAKLIVAGGICKVLKGKYENVDGVKLIGYVDDPKDLYSMGDVAINPVYQGTGLKIKTFEAISYDKVTLVHPHSMAGIFKKDVAPLFASDKPEEWVSFLDTVWEHEENIKRIKSQNEKYLAEMNVFIVNEYRRFLEI